MGARNPDPVPMEEVEDLASVMPADRIKQIAQRCLGLDLDIIDNLQDESKGNKWKFCLDLLYRYINTNGNTREVSFYIDNS